MARKSSLGPFPKTRSLVGILGSEVGAFAVIEACRARIKALKTDDALVSTTLFLVALPVASRSADSWAAFSDLVGVPVGDDFEAALLLLLPSESLARRAGLAALERFRAGPRFLQIGSEGWACWRELDGSAFCELGRQLFACVAEEILLEGLLADTQTRSVGVDGPSRLAWEMSKITQSFSARWFNKCAVGQIPGRESVRWYLGHCLGKLDWEFERELPGYVEEPYVSRRARTAEPPSLGLPLFE